VRLGQVIQKKLLARVRLVRPPAPMQACGRARRIVLAMFCYVALVVDREDRTAGRQSPANEVLRQRLRSTLREELRASGAREITTTGDGMLVPLSMGQPGQRPGKSCAAARFVRPSASWR